jgi:tRNA G46 methylase TrmB
MRKKYSTWIDSKSLEYHNVQWTEPKESTKAFSKLISPWMTESKKVVDIGCGAGAATAYLALINPKVNFTGLDYEKYLMAEATRRSKSANVKNVDFQVGDIFKLKKGLMLMESRLAGYLILKSLWSRFFERLTQGGLL